MGGALRLISVLGLGIGLTLAACGDDDDNAATTTAAGAQSVSVKATDALRFDPDHLTATAGVIHITLDNTGATTHTFVIEGQKFKLTNDDSGDVDLAAGNYVFYCDVPGHRDAGMEGTLAVSP
jgi:plastocyanin